MPSISSSMGKKIFLWLRDGEGIQRQGKLKMLTETKF